MTHIRIRNISESIRMAIIGMAVLVVCSCSSGSGNKGKDIKGIEDLKKDCVIGVQLGTTSDVIATQLEDEGHGTKVDRYTKSADAIQALLQGKIDCMVEDEHPAKAFQRQNPTLKILPQEFGHSGLAICVAKQNPQLLHSIDAAIETLQKNGTIDSIVRRHIDRNIAVAYTPKPASSISSKKIRFSTNAAFEPFEYYDNGKIVGIDVDVAKAICDEMGVDMEIVDMEFDAVITSVQTGKADAGIAGITVTEERKKNVNFTMPYTDVKQMIIVNTENAEADTPSLGEKFKACFVTGDRYQYLLKGLGNTITITIFAIILSLILTQV